MIRTVWWDWEFRHRKRQSWKRLSIPNGVQEYVKKIWSFFVPRLTNPHSLQMEFVVRDENQDRLSITVFDRDFFSPSGM